MSHRSRKERRKRQSEPVPPKELSGEVVARFEVTASRQTQISFSGPIPPPEILKAYNIIIPNGAERIMAMAEKQAEHRRHLERTVVEGNTRNQTIGMFLGFILSLVVIGVGGFLLYFGRDTAGLSLILVDLAILAGVFVYGRKSQEAERKAKLARS